MNAYELVALHSRWSAFICGRPDLSRPAVYARFGILMIFFWIAY
jgi:hypothetical protein